VDKSIKTVSGSNKSFSKTKNLNSNSTNFNSREDKNYVRKIFNNLNQKTNYDEKISFNNNYATVKVSATCVSTKNNNNKNTDKTPDLAGRGREDYDFDYCDYGNLKANNTQNALTNYSYMNGKTNNEEYKTFSGSNSILTDDLMKNDFKSFNDNNNNRHSNSYKIINNDGNNRMYKSNADVNSANLNQTKFNIPVLENASYKR
jgi:hypothetical protein